MLSIKILSLFMVSVIAICIIPGPAVLFIISKGVQSGKKSAIVSSFGICCAGITHILILSLGFNLLLQQNPNMIKFVKVIGGGYLVFLSLENIFRRKTIKMSADQNNISLFKEFFAGYFVQFTNIKSLLFYVSFLPIFIQAHNLLLDRYFVFLGLLFVMIAFIVDISYSILASHLSKIFGTQYKIQNIAKYLPSVMYFILGMVAIFN